MPNPYENIINKDEKVEESTNLEMDKKQSTSEETPIVEQKQVTEKVEDDVDFLSELNDQPSEEAIANSDTLTEWDNDDVKSSELDTPVYYYTPREVDVPETNVKFVPANKLTPFKERKVAVYDVDKTPEKPRNTDIVLMTVRGTQQSVLSSLERLDSNLFELHPEEMARWTEAVAAANNQYMLADDQLFEATIRKGAMWVNMLNHGTEEETAYKGPTSDRRGRISAVGDDGRKSSMAILTNILKLGVPSYIPLYHTGIWVKLRTPSVADFVALDEIIVQEKIDYGMLTRGQIFSNDSVVVRKHAVDFILDHVEQTTAPSDDPEYLKSIIKTADLDMLIIGLMLSRYPDGYPLVQTCTANPSKCRHAVEGLVDLRTLSWVDSARLTAKQYKTLNRLKGRLTEEDLKAYQEEFKQFTNTKLILSEGEVIEDNDDISLKDGVIINFEMPTFAKDEMYGVNWVREIHEIDEDAFREKLDANKRREIVESRIRTSGFNIYGQWIKSIEIIEGGLTRREITDEEELNEIFQLLAGDIRYTDAFTKMFKRFLTDNVVHLGGIVNYVCPSCGKKQDTRDGNHHIILPLDMLSIFFTLVRSSVRASFRRIIS